MQLPKCHKDVWCVCVCVVIFYHFCALPRSVLSFSTLDTHVWHSPPAHNEPSFKPLINSKNQQVCLSCLFSLSSICQDRLGYFQGHSTFWKRMKRYLLGCLQNKAANRQDENSNVCSMADSIYIKVKQGMFSCWTFPYLRVAGLSISYQVRVPRKITLTNTGPPSPVKRCCVTSRSKVALAM